NKYLASLPSRRCGVAVVVDWKERRPAKKFLGPCIFCSYENHQIRRHIMSKKTLKEIASDFGAERRTLHHRFKAAAASTEPATLADQGVRQIPVPQGAHVEVTVPGFGISSQVILNHVLQPQSSTYVLD